MLTTRAFVREECPDPDGGFSIKAILMIINKNMFVYNYKTNKGYTYNIKPQ